MSDSLVLEPSVCSPAPEGCDVPSKHWLRFKGEIFVARWEVWQDESGWSLPTGFLTPKQAAAQGYEYLMSLDELRLKNPI